MVSNTRLYGASIAVVSGVYSLSSASMATRLGAGGWLMALLGAVVVLHGAALLTDVAERLGSASGPLMIAYAVLMLLNQALLGTGTIDGGGMDGGMGGGGMGMGGGMGGSPMTAGMGWDAGMVALAALMLVSGLVMTRGDDTGDAAGGM